MADALDLLLADGRHPPLLAHGARRALLLDLHEFAGHVALLAGARIAHPAAGLTDAPRDHGAGHLAGLRFPVSAVDLDRLGEPDGTADLAADVALAGLPHRLAHGVGNLLGAHLTDRLADRVGLLPLLVDGLADGVGDLPGHRLVDRLADGVGLLAGLVDGPTHGVGDLLGHRLVDGLADGVRLLTGLIDGLADRVGDLLGPRLPDGLADGVGDRAGPGFPDGLADGVFHLLEAPLLLVADAVDLPLLHHLLADGLVAGVFLLLVDHVLDEPRAAARRGRRAGRVTGRLVVGTAGPGGAETDGRHHALAVLVAGQAAIGGLDSAGGGREGRDRQQAEYPRDLHDCRLGRGGLLYLRLEREPVNDDGRWARPPWAHSPHPQPSAINSPQVDQSP